jgi:hypothetical protein
MTVPYLSQQPIDDFGLRFSDIKFSSFLSIGVEQTLVVPGVARRYKVIIKSGAPSLSVWAALNQTAAAPAGAPIAATTSELIPPSGSICREVKAGDIIHLKSADPFATGLLGAPVSVLFYSIGTSTGI